MDKLRIIGGYPLCGKIRISGSKNCSLPLLASSILTDEEVVLDNVPDLKDVGTFLALLEILGVRVARDGSRVVLNAGKLSSCIAPYELVSTMRASVLVMGPLLARLGKTMVSLPGGCALGTRPIDLHLKFFERLGAEVKLVHGFVKATMQKPEGKDFYFDVKTVTGTMNAMFLAVLTPGVTVLKNCALEPEVSECANMLKKMGAKIEGIDTENISITGVDKLQGCRQTVIPDRIECGTYLLAVATAGGQLFLHDCRADHLSALIEQMVDCGIMINADPVAHTIEILAERKPSSADIQTRPYPGFPTDLQAPFMAMLGIADGSAVVNENIFENRFMHVSELQRMGADLQIRGNSVFIKGIERYSGAKVMSTDIRAGAALVVAGLNGIGETIVSRIYHIDRGYEKIEEKLSQAGARIERISA